MDGVVGGGCREGRCIKGCLGTNKGAFLSPECSRAPTCVCYIHLAFYKVETYSW